MRQLTCDPKTETLGLNALAFTSNLRSEDTTPIMEKHGLANLQPTDWFATQKLLDALNDLGKDPNFMSGLVAMGMAVGKIVPIEQENPTLGEVLMVWDGIYQGLHRNGEAGHLKCEKEDDKHYKLTFTDLYPDDFSYGIMYGYAQRFLPPGADFTIFYEPNVRTRDQGGTQGHTVIHAKWK